MNSALVSYYVEGMLNGWFCENSSTMFKYPSEIQRAMRLLESKLGRSHGSNRCTNPEWGEATKLLETPLMKALG